MKLRIRNNQMEEVEGLHNEYPYAFHHVDLAKTDVPWHWHEALEFGLILSGSVKIATAGQVETLTQGEGFFINSNVLASMTKADACIMDTHLFHPVFLAGHFKSVFETKYIAPVTQNRKLDMLILRGGTKQQKEILRKLKELSSLQAQTDVEFQTRNLLSEIWLLLLDELNQTQIKTTALKNQDRILSMIAFIQENFAQKLTLSDIADASAVSTRECLRCFRSAIGQSPMEYLIEYRVQRACRLLETTALPITQIAMQTGWGSSSYFTKMFHQIRGKTPNAYRKELKDLQKEAY